jgi:hypothetical protein
MKRDMDLIRRILLEMEKLPMTGGWYNLEIVGHSRDEMIYHVRLMDEAGLIEAQDLTTLQGIDWCPKRITYTGHEFLDAARNDKVWKTAKDRVLSTTGTLTLEAMKLALGAAMKALLTG